jgi:hypothetical protein
MSAGESALWRDLDEGIFFFGTSGIVGDLGAADYT